MISGLRTLSASAAVVALMALTPATGWSQDAEEEDPVIATVGEEEIRMSEVSDMIAVMPPQFRQVPIDVLIPFVADQLAIGRVIAERAREEGLTESEAFQERMVSAERAILRDVWLEAQIAERITDEMLAEAYEAFVAESAGGGEVRARHILLETVEDAEAVIDELDGGADFAELARDRSVGPSAQNGGDLGWFTRRDMVAEFAEAAFALEPGEYGTEPVETRFGWHVILVEDRRSEEPPPFEAVEEELTAGLRDDITQEVIEGLREGAEIVIFGPDGEPIDPASIIP